MSPPRVLVVAQRAPPWQWTGQEQLALNLTRTLGLQGLDTSLLTTRFEWGQPPREVVDGVDVRRVPSLPGPLLKASQTSLIAAAVVRRRPDLVHAFSLSASAVGAVAGARLARRPVFLSPSLGGDGGEVATMRRALGAEAVASTLAAVDCVIAAHPEDADELVASGARPGRVVVLDNAVDCTRFAPAPSRAAARDALGLPQEPTFVFLGQLTPRKNLDVLVDAFARARSVLGRGTLLLVGAGPDEARLRARARVTPGMRLLPPKADVRPVLHAADVYTLCSHREMFSISLLEALACGVPAAVSPQASPPTLGLHEVGGLVASPTSAEFADALVRLGGDARLRTRLGQGARRLAEARDVSGYAAKLRALYARVGVGT